MLCAAKKGIGAGWYNVGMPKILIMPHEELCPEGAALSCAPGVSLCDLLLENNIALEHACEKSCACTTCHVIIREGGGSLNEPSEDEEDMLDKAWGLEADSRLACQAIVSDADLTVEIPKYTINHARENH